MVTGDWLLAAVACRWLLAARLLGCGLFATTFMLF